MHADRLDAAILDRTEKSAEAIDEGLATDEAHIFVVLGLPEQMLARAEADLEPNLVDGRHEQLGQGGGGSGVQVEAETRQQLADQPLLPRAQRLGFPPAIGPERSCFGHSAVAELSMVDARDMQAVYDLRTG